MMQNTKINFLNYLVSIGNRLIITNALYFFYGATTLGSFGSFLAFSAGAVLVSSICDMEICKQRIQFGFLHLTAILANIIICLLFLSFYFDLSVPLILLALLFLTILNSSLIISGFLFQADLFIVHRKVCIFAEVLEILIFAICTLITDDPLFSLGASMMSKNLIIISISGYFFIRRDVLTYYRLKTKDKSSGLSNFSTSHGDILGNILFASLLPLSVSLIFGLKILGDFIFIKQFFAIGNSFQAAIFRGLWRDQLKSTKSLGFVKYFSYFNLSAPIVVFICAPLLYPFENLILFWGCGCMFIFTTWARNRVLVLGHIQENDIFNFEITFVLLYLMVSILNVITFELELGFVFMLAASIATIKVLHRN